MFSPEHRFDMVLSVDWVGTRNVRCEPSTHDVRMTGQDPASGCSCHWDLLLAPCCRFEGLLDSIALERRGIRAGNRPAFIALVRSLSRRGRGGSSSQFITHLNVFAPRGGCTFLLGFTLVSTLDPSGNNGVGFSAG